MWSMQQPGPSRFDRLEVPPPSPDRLEDGQVILRFAAGGICGSDIPKFQGMVDPDNPCTGQPGAPLHELVGYVEATRNPDFHEGHRVVGHVPGSRGLSEYLAIEGSFLHRLGDELSDVVATMVQPLSTVLSSIQRVPSMEGKSVAVVGLGPLGLLFTHAFKSMGAAQVIGVDRVDRAEDAERFGIDLFLRSESRDWRNNALACHDAPDLVVDAVGHRQEIVDDAVNVVKYGGHVLVFGLPEDHYVFPMRSFFRKGLTMSAGSNKDWPTYLRSSEQYVLKHPQLVDSYISHVMPVTQAETAYRLYSVPARGRYKVVLSAEEDLRPDASRTPATVLHGGDR